MTSTSWLRKLRFQTNPRQKNRRSVRGRPAAARPSLEHLEDRLTPSIVTLASFNGTNGGSIAASPIVDSSGNLYGTAEVGATGYGSVYEVSQGSGTITTLASFDLSTGGAIGAGLIMDGSGNLYGATTGDGGSSDFGHVFEVAKNSNIITTLASLPGKGALPGALAMDNSGNLYGLSDGGDSSLIVFELANGSGTITTLASFDNTTGRSFDGLLIDGSGNLYGTTINGGASNDGTVFELAKGSGTITTLASFDGTNGKSPRDAPIRDSSGNLYGTTFGGGDSNNGTVFELANGSGTITTLASFDSTTGRAPNAGLVMDSSGNLYGTTNNGGAYDKGTLFELVNGIGPIITLGTFNGDNGSLPLDFGALAMDSGGNLYGTTVGGGLYNSGTVFEFSTGSSFAVSGLPASAVAGTSTTFTVAAQNADGSANNAYTGTVHFTTSDPQAMLPADFTFSAADDGVHTFNVTFKTAGSQSITVTDLGDNLIKGTSTPITVTAASAVGLLFNDLPTIATAGIAFPVTVTAEDAYGNTATGYTGLIHFTSSDSNASLPANSTLTNGTRTFAVTFDGAGNQSLNLTDTVSSSLTVSSAIFVNPARADHLVFGVQPSNCMAGGAISPAVQVQVFDVYGNLETGDHSDQVTLSVASGPEGFTTGSTKTVTVNGGIATFSNLVLITPGAYTLAESATDGLTGPNSISFTVGALPADHIGFIVPPTSAMAGVAINPSVEVAVLDRLGNIIGDDNSDRITLSVASGPGGFTPGSTTTVQVSGGIATFTNLVLDTAGTYTLGEISTSGLGGEKSSSFAITPARANHLAFGVQPSNLMAGATVNPAVLVKVFDVYGNLGTGDNSDQVTISVASGPGDFTATSTKIMTVSGGIATFNNLVLNTPGVYTLGESATGGLAGPNSSSFTVALLPPDHLGFLIPPSTTLAGAAINPGVQVGLFDRLGNLVSGDNSDGVTLVVASGPGGFAAGSTTTAKTNGGVATFNNLVLDVSGTYILGQSATGGLTGPSSVSFTILPATGDHLGFGLPPSGTNAGRAISPGVIVKLFDSFGNLVTGDSGDQVSLIISSGPGGFAPGSTTTATVDGGIATFSNLVFDTTGTYTLAESATGQLTGPNSSSFTVLPGPAKQLMFSVQPGDSMAGGAINPAVQVQVFDGYGNLETGDNNDQVTLAVASGPGSFAPGSTTTVSASGGVATFSGLELNKAGAGYTLRALATGMITAISSPFAVTPGPATQLLLSSLPLNPVVADSAASIALTLLDATGNVATGYTGTVAFSSSDAMALLPGSYTFTAADKGAHTFAATLETSGAQTLAVTDTANTSLGATASMLVVVVSKIVPVNQVTVIYGPLPNSSQNVAFIKGLYQLILGRSLDVGGLNYWLQTLSTGGASLQERQQIVAQGFWNSYENRAREVNDYYETYLGRKADAQGLGFWITQLQSGKDETVVVAYFLLQQEAAKLPNNAWLTNLYQGTLGRSPDPAGFTYWLGQLNDQEMSRGQIENSFVMGPEAAGAAVDSFYIDYLQRVPDSQGRSHWVDAITSGNATYASVAEMLLSSDEFFASAAKTVS
jgi:uncharacterized repeat protein (TIGR03803 family)